ncbi:MAG TPA: YicC/YloC family endoribonuclease [Propylenella sp.]|nr:YicC/YloC family endoribonuclease [Propylenella sp.]
MPLSSMTGFARTTFEAEGAKFAWELKSVNARGLEIRLRLPAGLDHLEADIRVRVREHLARGSCFLALQKEGDSDRQRLMLNEEALALVVAAARRLAEADGIAMPTADGLLSIPGVLQDRGEALGGDAAERRDTGVLHALGEGLEALKQARQQEGQRLRAVLEDQLTKIGKLVDMAGDIAAEAPDVLKARIQDQVAQLTTERGLDPDRLYQEAVLLATRSDVREELDRLRSHVTAARELLASHAAVGRRLEFLAQEFNREANTLCSKAFDRRLTAIGVELKAVIDQFREQVQNLE